MPIIIPDQPYTYSKYFEQRIDPIDLCEYFGYSLSLEELLLLNATVESLSITDLSITDLSITDLSITDLKQRISRISTRLISRNEQAKQEMLIAPVIEFVVETADAFIRID